MSQTPDTSKNTKFLFAILGFVAFMVGVSFAAVPLYDAFCRATGFGGTPQQADQNLSQMSERRIKIHFNTDTQKNIPWQFGPEVRQVTVNVGQNGFINFKAKNTTTRTITGTAIYNVTPLKVGKYFVKTQCFCFEEQTLNPGQSVNMPVVFYVDPAIEDDPTMDDISVITLSYSFFRSDSEELEKAVLEN